jgi:penicillin-binding protein 1C
MQSRNWFVLSPVMEYYYRRKHAEYQVLPPVKPGCETREEMMEFIYPQELDRVFIPKPLDGSQGQVIFELTHRTPSATIFWYLDNQYIGKTTDFHQVNIRTAAGWHRMTVTDMDGNQLVKRFQVVEK